MSLTRLPARYDHVGSFLRPQYLLEARAQKAKGEISAEQLRAVEDKAITEIVRFQESVGLKSITDGEFRRRSWWLDLIMGWEGFSADRAGMSEVVWRNKQGGTMASSRLWATGPIRWKPSATVRAFEFLKRNTSLVPKVTLPAPLILHMFGGGDKGILEGHYKDIDAFWADVVTAYRQEVRALVAAGATYIQFDDTSIAFLCDPVYRDAVQRWGTEPEALLRIYAKRMNEVLEAVPDGVTVTFHQCRGNREGHWMAEGGYDPVADVLFNVINVHGYFLEYDSERAGGFAPLRLLPKGKVVVLGIMSSKTPELESADALRKRIDEAAKVAPLEQLAISPQCGFSSSIGGNPLTEADQEKKLARLVEVARSVWG